jgi:hypothetical protein
VTFHFSHDVFRLNFTFKSAERILEGFALLQSNFCHVAPLHQIPAIRVFYKRRFRTVGLPVTGAKPRRQYKLLANVIAGSRLLLSARFIRAKIE